MSILISGIVLSLLMFRLAVNIIVHISKLTSIIVYYLFMILFICIAFLQRQVYLVLLVYFHCVWIVWQIELFGMLREIILKGLLMGVGTCALRSLFVLRKIC